MTSPNGKCELAIGMMQEKAQQWINAVRNKHPHCRNVWFSLKMQLWPWIGYGLCSSTATLKKLDMALHQQYYQILSLGRIVRTTMVQSRAVDTGFFSAGLPHLGIEAIIAMSNKLLVHFGCQMATGRLMQVSYSLLFVEVGLSFQLFHIPYTQFKHLATHSWIKMLKEKLSKFKVRAVVSNVYIDFPHEGYEFIMQVLTGCGYPNDMLHRFNHVRVYQQLLFMLDILMASRNNINS